MRERVGSGKEMGEHVIRGVGEVSGYDERRSKESLVK